MKLSQSLYKIHRSVTKITPGELLRIFFSGILEFFLVFGCFGGIFEFFGIFFGASKIGVFSFSDIRYSNDSLFVALKKYKKSIFNPGQIPRSFYA